MYFLIVYLRRMAIYFYLAHDKGQRFNIESWEINENNVCTYSTDYTFIPSNVINVYCVVNID